MAWTGAATVIKVADALARITGVSLAAGASGTIGLAGSGADIELPEGLSWGPYDGIDLAEAIEVSILPSIPLTVAKAASPFLITVTNDQAAALGSQAIVGKMSLLDELGQDIPDGIATTIDFDTEVFDVGACVEVANDRFVAPVAGKYLINASVLWGLGAFDGSLTLNVLVGGVAVGTAVNVVSLANDTKDPVLAGSQLSTVLDLAAGALVTFQVTQDSGAPYPIGTAEASIQLIAGAAPAATGGLEIYCRFH